MAARTPVPVAAPFESRRHAIVDAAVGIYFGLFRVAQARPLFCSMCGASVTSLATWQAGFQIARQAIPCRRIRLPRFSRCEGQLARDRSDANAL